jgi:hypothetical protein
LDLDLISQLLSHKKPATTPERLCKITFPVCMGLSGNIILFVKFWLLAIGNVLGFKVHLLVAFFW